MTEKSPKMSPKTAPWSVRVRRDDVPEAGLHLELIADAPSRAAIAALAALRGLDRLEASFDLARQGQGLRVSGEVRASVEQTCVVTLEPMTSEIVEPIDLVFRPPGTAAGLPADLDADLQATLDASLDIADIDPVADDEPELLIDGIADLGSVATEFLLLAIDPHPRKPGVVFAAPATGDPRGQPFAALAALKKTPPKPR
jgi:hypothetical protein